MEWALIILFCAAIVLLILSFFLSKKTTEKQERDNEMFTASLMNEVAKLQEQIQNLELDTKIIANEANLRSTAEQRVLLREVLDLYNRKYSIKTIASQKELTENEIERMIAPYKTTTKKGNATNDN